MPIPWNNGWADPQGIQQNQNALTIQQQQIAQQQLATQQQQQLQQAIVARRPEATEDQQPSRAEQADTPGGDLKKIMTDRPTASVNALVQKPQEPPQNIAEVQADSYWQKYGNDQLTQLNSIQAPLIENAWKYGQDSVREATVQSYDDLYKKTGNQNAKVIADMYRGVKFTGDRGFDVTGKLSDPDKPADPNDPEDSAAKSRAKILLKMAKTPEEYELIKASYGQNVEIKRTEKDGMTIKPAKAINQKLVTMFDAQGNAHQGHYDADGDFIEEMVGKKPTGSGGLNNPNRVFNGPAGTGILRTYDGKYFETMPNGERRYLSSQEAEERFARAGANKKSFELQVKQFDAIDTFVNNLHGNVSKIDNLVDQLARTDQKWLNVPLREYQKAIKGDPNEAILDMLFTEISTEANKVASGAQQSIAAPSADMTKKWDDIHSRTLAPAAMKTVAHATQDLADQRRETIKNKVEGIGERIEQRRPVDKTLHEPKAKTEKEKDQREFKAAATAEIKRQIAANNGKAPMTIKIDWKGQMHIATKNKSGGYDITPLKKQ